MMRMTTLRHSGASLLAALCFSLLLAAPAALAASSTAKGRFQSKAASFNAGSAVAFRGFATLDKAEPALIVAVTNVSVRPEMVAMYHDRKRAIENRVKDDETAVVYFELTPDGKYRGLSYYFGSGNGCGYCGGGVTSTVKLANGRLAGTLKGEDKESDRRFDVTLDVPVMADDHGAPLAAGGGEPGAAYQTYHEALMNGSPAALEPVLSDTHLESFAAAKKSKDLDGFVKYLRKEHPTGPVKITKGWAKPDSAVLLVEGEAGGVVLAGEVVLLKQRGAWRVDDEVTQVK